MLCIFCLVLAALSDGRVMELEIDINAADGHARRCYHINAVQSVMSNLLSNIGQTGECLTRMKLDTEAKDSILEQLAIAGSLLHKRSASLICCNIVASVDDTSLPFCRRISASLSNRASFTLGHNWTFLMSVSPSAKWCSCKDYVAGCKFSDVDSRSLYTSCDVSGLCPGESNSLSLVIDHEDHSSAEIFYIVETALIYTPINHVNAATKPVSISLTTQRVDILDFVRLASSPTSYLYPSTVGSFASDSRKLLQLCRPHVKDDSGCISADELQLKKKNTVSVKEHVVSLYASKLSNMQGIADCLFRSIHAVNKFNQFIFNCLLKVLAFIFSTEAFRVFIESSSWRNKE